MAKYCTGPHPIRIKRLIEYRKRAFECGVLVIVVRENVNVASQSHPIVKRFASRSFPARHMIQHHSSQTRRRRNGLGENIFVKPGDTPGRTAEPFFRFQQDHSPIAGRRRRLKHLRHPPSEFASRHSGYDRYTAETEPSATLLP